MRLKVLGRRNHHMKKIIVAITLGVSLLGTQAFASGAAAPLGMPVPVSQLGELTGRYTLTKGDRECPQSIVLRVGKASSGNTQIAADDFEVFTLKNADPSVGDTVTSGDTLVKALSFNDFLAPVSGYRDGQASFAAFDGPNAHLIELRRDINAHSGLVNPFPSDEHTHCIYFRAK